MDTNVKKEFEEKNKFLNDLIFHNLSGKLIYAKAMFAVGLMKELSEKTVEWSGAKMELRVDPEPFKKNPKEWEVQPPVDFDDQLWQPFPDTFTKVTYPEKVPVNGALADIKTISLLWNASKKAKDMHTKKDRLDGVVLGVLIHPDTEELEVYWKGRDLRDVMMSELSVTVQLPPDTSNKQQV